MAGNRAVFEQAVNEGNSAAWEHQWERAVAAYGRAIDEFPDDSNVLSNLGLALLALNRQEEALIVYQQAARVNPRDPVPIEKCGEIFERLGRKKEASQTYFAVAEVHVGHRDVNKAIENWARAVMLSPDNLKAHSRLALAYERTGRTKEAVVEYLAVARIRQKEGEPQQAMDAIRQALRLDPQHAEARLAAETVQRGGALPEPPRLKGFTSPLRPLPEDVFSKLEELAPAERALGEFAHGEGKKWNPLESDRRTALTTLAGALFEFGEDDGAETGTGPLKSLRGSRAQMVTLLSQAIDVQTKGDAQAAAGLYEKALRAGMNHPALHYTLGAIFLDLDRYKDSIKLFTAATNHPAYRAGAEFALGLCYGREGKMQEAVSHLLQCLQVLDAGTVPASQAEDLRARYEILALSAGRNSNDEELTQIGENLVAFLSGPDWEDRLQQARKQLNAESDPGVWLPLAELLATPGVERAVESMGLVERYLKKGWLETAMDEAHRAIAYAPSYLPAHVKVAEILVAQNRTEIALEKFGVIARMYLMDGDNIRAGKILEIMVQLNPLDLETREQLIELLLEQGRTPDAIRHYIDMAESHYNLAAVEKARETYAEALKLAQQPGVDKNWSVRIWHRMGDFDVQLLDWRQAVRIYDQIKGVDPLDGKARSMLIDLYFRLGQARPAVSEMDDMIKHFASAKQLPKALQVLEELAGNRPDEVALKSRLARLYQEAGRKAEALAVLDALGEAHLQAGRRADAIQTIQDIIALGPDNVDSYRKLLAELKAPG